MAERVGLQAPHISRSHLLSFFDELKRRKVFRVVIGYVVGAWVLVQVADLVADIYLAPVWVMQMIVTLLVVGLPISLILSWAFDLTRDGIIRTHYDSAAGQRTISSKHFYTLIAGLVVVVAVTLFFTWPPEEDRSIAVLPFEDLSPAGDQEYFGNGIADELRLELQRLDGLRVAGRTSSIASTQNDEDLMTIGEFLNVDSILEGSIRKEGNRIKIVAQLINADDGFPIWSESYDRELANIFETQEEIATSVAGTLGVRLGVGGVNEFQGAGTLNVEAYEAYLQSENVSGPARLSQPARISELELAIQLDPNYAAAWARLGAATIATMWNFPPDEAPAIIERAYPFVRRAIELNPESALAHTYMGAAQYVQMDWIGGEESLTKAVGLLSDRDTVAQYGNMLMRTGRSAAARTQYDKAETLEPLGGRPLVNRQYVSIAQGKFAEAKEVIAWKDERSMTSWNVDIALNEGDPEEIKTALQAMLTSNNGVFFAQVLSEFDSLGMVLSTLRAVYADTSAKQSGMLSEIALLAAYFDDPEFALQVIAEDVRYTPVRIGSLWFPVMSEVRHLPEFKELVTELNLVAYWRTYGWADTCRPLGDDNFECN
jgi:TolB-like protein